MNEVVGVAPTYDDNGIVVGYVMYERASLDDDIDFIGYFTPAD
jgi:hypothetical protein